MGATGYIEGFDAVDGSHTLTFPNDHGPHAGYLFEWWYLTAILDDANGREFGVQFTIFRRALTTDRDSSNKWRTGQIYLAHVALSDIHQEMHYDHERFSRGHIAVAGARAEPFQVFVEDWKLASTTVNYFPLELNIHTLDYKASLKINQGKPMILHGTDGYSQKTLKHASYYYSYSNLPTSGTIELDGQEFIVSGRSWLDREWSSHLLSEPYQGWYWFSLMFDSGREMVVFALHSDRSVNESNPTATWIETDGSMTPIPEANWSIKPRRYWKSYPVAWILEVNGTKYTIAAKFDDQIMDTHIRYWEGVVDIRTPTGVVGRGYMELTGYE